MCGIAGIWSKSPLTQEDDGALAKAGEAIRQRGPDAKGTYRLDKAALTHRRLSIIDTNSRSDQPMRWGSFSLVFNGEIYNYHKLKKLLIKEYGHEFKTESDTEVLLVGLALKGVDFLKEVNGFFAFALYNEKDHSLTLARDRFGIKPLLYSWDGNRFVFGSSLGTIMPFIAQSEIDTESLSLYLGLSYIPAPKTILRGVLKMNPGEFMIISEGKTDSGSFYSLNAAENEAIGFEEAKSKLRELLGTSVERRLVADVPLGTFLSGGVDSSIISYLASRSNKGLPAFSIGFPDYPYFDESKKAARVARHLGLEHHIIEVSEKNLDEHLDDILSALDEPFADSSAVLVSLVSKFAAGHVKVVLSGDGADELLGGYNKHRGLLRSLKPDWKNKTLKTASPALNVLPSSRNKKTFDGIRKIKRYSKGLRLSFGERYLEWACFTPEKKVSDLLQSHYHYSESESLRHYLNQLDPESFNSVLKTDFNLVLANDMLHKVDAMSMHRSLEVRVPFLDHELVDFVFTLKSSYKLNSKSGKIMLKEAFSDVFPKGFLDGAKRGFEAPLTHWYKGPLRDRLKSYFNEDHIKKQGLFEFREVERVVKKALGPSPGDSPHTLWALLVFQHWYSRHFINSTHI